MDPSVRMTVARRIPASSIVEAEAVVPALPEERSTWAETTCSVCRRWNGRGATDNAVTLRPRTEWQGLRTAPAGNMLGMRMGMDECRLRFMAPPPVVALAVAAWYPDVRRRCAQH